MRVIKTFAAVAATCSVFLLGALTPDRAMARGAAVNWTSVYVGLHGGYSSADVDWRSNYPFSSLARPTDFDAGSQIWGTQIGYMIQRGNWVFGGELALSGGFDRDVKTGVDLYAGILAGTMSVDVSYMLQSTARLGYAWGNVLGYVKAGTAAARVGLKTDDNVPFPEYLSSSTRLYTGWVLGAGFEYEIVPNLMLGVEYSYVTLDGRVSAAINPVPISFRSRIDLESHSILARVNYKMDAPALATLLPF